jgi:Protein of unknown function (DUF1806)
LNYNKYIYSALECEDMQLIQTNEVQQTLDQLIGKELYLHLETTNGAYANHNNESVLTVNAYIRNGKVTPLSGKIMGSGPYRVGLKIELGWIYAEGLTHWEIDNEGRLLMAGHDSEGRLAVALQLSSSPFDV